ncbi:MAG: tRNA epoxyqueuosine(34) reductase QueG [Bacteroidia bacterium]
MDCKELTRKIKQRGYELGFDLVGVSAATLLDQEARNLEQWLRQGQHGQMQYMENHFDKRIDPRLLVEGARSVISVIHNYHPQPEHKQPEGAPRISRYAWGEDYHRVLKRKLYELFLHIQALAGAEVPGRVFVDSAPVMDKAWAARSGLGWIGKHTNLIVPRRGSFFFIGEVILALDLEYDGPVRDYCGTCTRCIDACPTQALSPYQIDASRCISYLTIELKDDIPPGYHDQLDGWAYGCDICQEVCPWNRFARPHAEPAFDPFFHTTLTRQDWEELDERTFKKLSRHTAMNRTRWQKLKQNLRLVLGHTPTAD